MFSRRVALVLLLSSMPLSSVARGQQAVLQPLLTIGSISDTMAQLNAIGGVTRLGSGQLAVVNGAPPEIRLYSPAGRFERLIGRPGSGPGELSTPGWYGRSGDSLLLYDVQLARITIYDVPGKQVSTMPFAPRAGPPGMIVIGHITGDAWLVATVGRPAAHAGVGPFWDSTSAGIWRAQDGDVQVIGRFPYFPYFATGVANSGGRSSPSLDRVRSLGALLAAAGRIWVGNPDSDELLVYDASGSFVRRVSTPFRRLSLSESELGRARDLAMTKARTAADSTRTARIYNASRRSELAPAFSRVLPGFAGTVWVEQYRLDPEDPSTYARMDERGHVLSRLACPAHVRLFEIGNDYAAGVRKDENDVETVVLYRLLQ